MRRLKKRILFLEYVHSKLETDIDIYSFKWQYIYSALPY